MPNLFSAQEAKNFDDADDENLIPASDYRAKILTIDRMPNKPETIQWVFRLMGGQVAAGRQVRTWTSTAPAGAWATKRLIKDLVVDPATLQLEDLEGKIVKARVTIEERSDTHENTNRVVKLSPWTGSADEDLDVYSAGYDESDEPA